MKVNLSTSVDKFTFIQAETAPTVGNGDLDFYAANAGKTAAQQVGQWNRTNLKDYTGTIVGTQTTQNVFNTTATTVNAFGAATTLSIGASTGNTTVNNNLVVTGNFTVNGTTTTVNATTVDVADLNITVAKNAANASQANGAGLTVAGASATLLYGSGSDNWTFNKPLAVTGTLSVSSNATVSGSLTSSGSIAANGGVALAGGTALTSSFGNWTGEQNKIQWHSTHLYFQNTDSGRLAVFRQGSGNEPCTISNAGVITCASIQTTSDIKLKENIVTISNASEIINSLRGVTFDWKATQKKSYGLIAQEVEAILPELVEETVDDSLNPNSEKTKTVDYDKIVSVLIEGWKEQQSQIQNLQQEVASLKAKLGE